jgi:hypothetical protein
VSARTAARFLQVPILVGVAVLALHVVASYFSLDRDVAAAKAHVVQAFERGQFTENPYQHPSVTIGSHQWNDCLITLMAIDQRGDRARLTLSPVIARIEGCPDHPQADTNPCAVLQSIVAGAKLDPELYHYDRYVHGATVLLRYLLPHLEVGQIRSLYRTASIGVLVLGFGLCLAGLARRTRVAEFAVVAVALAALMRFFGLEFFSQSLGHSPADLIIGCYLLALVVMLFASTGPVTVLLAAAIFGAFTIVFELFTGGVPLGLAIVLGLSSLVVRPGSQLRGAPLALWAATAFLGAAGVVYVLKVLAVVAIADVGVLTDIVQRARYYSPAADTGFQLVHFLRAVGGSVGVLAGGLSLLAWAALAGGIAAGACGAHWLRHDATDPVTRQHAVLLAASVLPIPLWFLAFANQTAEHAWFIDRILVWPIAAGFGLFTLAIANRRSAPAVLRAD